jgi:hypothetical protein
MKKETQTYSIEVSPGRSFGYVAQMVHNVVFPNMKTATTGGGLDYRCHFYADMRHGNRNAELYATARVNQSDFVRRVELSLPVGQDYSRKVAALRRRLSGGLPLWFRPTQRDFDRLLPRGARGSDIGSYIDCADCTDCAAYARRIRIRNSIF